MLRPTPQREHTWLKILPSLERSAPAAGGGPSFRAVHSPKFSGQHSPEYSGQHLPPRRDVGKLARVSNAAKPRAPAPAPSCRSATSRPRSDLKSNLSWSARTVQTFSTNRVNPGLCTLELPMDGSLLSHPYSQQRAVREAIDAGKFSGVSASAREAFFILSASRADALRASVWLLPYFFALGFWSGR